MLTQATPPNERCDRGQTPMTLPLSMLHRSLAEQTGSPRDRSPRRQASEPGDAGEEYRAAEAVKEEGYPRTLGS